ncbi:MAG: hypothetical protein ACT4P3_15985 [Betaproteobacteria bacterium]
MPKDIYAALGVKRRINAAGTLTRLGGALMDEEVVAAMAAAARASVVDRKKLNGIPHHGLGRGFKAGKEEIVGLLTALERFAAADDEAANAALEKRLQAIARDLGNRCRTKIVPARETGKVPQLHLTLQEPLEVSRRLQAGEPPVHLSERFAAQGVLIIDPQALRPEDDAAVVAALLQVLLA